MKRINKGILIFVLISVIGILIGYKSCEAQVPIVFSEGVLDSGETSTSRSMKPFEKATFQIVVDSINTTVDYRVEGSLDGSNWFNLGTSDTQKSANGTYFLAYETAVAFVRFVFVTEAGGSDADIDVTLLLWKP